MPSSIKLTEPLDILVEYGYLDDDTPYHKAVSNAVNDFSSDKTLGGEYNREYIEILQTEASKELKLRRKKIDVKSFKENFLNKKEEPVKADTTGTSSLVPYKPPSNNLDISVEKEEEKEETEGLKGIRDVLDEILGILRLDFKGDRNEARDARKAKVASDRKAKEDKLEGGVKKSVGLIGKSLKAIVSPFSTIWDAVFKFLKFTLLNVLFVKTLDWFGDPKNQKKAERIGKFFKDWWPALATAAALWLTPLGGLLKGVVGLLTAIIPKLVMAIAANPYAAMALVGTGLAVWGVSKLAGMKSGPDKAVDESVEEIGREETIEKLKEEQENRGVMGRVGDFFTGAGAEREQQIERLGGNVEMNEGGLVQSYSTQSNQQSNQSSNVQNYNEGGLVQNYNDQKSAQNFVQRYNEGGLVQNYNEGGMVENENNSILNFLNPLAWMGGQAQDAMGQADRGEGQFGGGLAGKMLEKRRALAEAEGFKQGGFVSGPAGVDKVPAKLTAGEFVMSKGAVQKYGVNTLASMNAAGGGTNVPTITQAYNQGGLVKSVGESDSRIIIDIIKKTTNNNMDPVDVPVPAAKNTTITLPTIPKNKPEETITSKNDIPEFRISMISTQRSMVISSLGIQDLIGG